MGYLLVKVEMVTNHFEYRSLMQPMRRLRGGSRFFLVLFLGGEEG
jgi:hypothetical protein